MAAPMENLFVRDFEKDNGVVLSINQNYIGDVGCVVWDAALVLSSYLETKSFCDKVGNSLLQGKKILELGAGTGIVGLQAASLGAAAVITDLEEFVPLLQLNIKTNQALLSGSAEARCLTWGTDITHFLPAPDYLMLSDCIYYEESTDPLVATIEALCDSHTVVLCCYEERTTGNKPKLQQRFMELMEKKFTSEVVPLEDQHHHYRDESIHIIKFKLQ